MLTTLLLPLMIQTSAPVPGPENLDRWIAYVRPKPAELGFEENRWKASFWEAVLESQKTGKPILLWAMNGHPMGCT